MTHPLIERATAILRDLVAFDSVSSNSNLPIIDYIERYFQNLDIAPIRVPSPDGKKSNILARIGPEAAGGVVLSGHTDVVPVAGQAWSTDPFTLTEKDGKLYGRGTCDMKGFIAICLALAPQFLALPLTRPVWLAFSYDEEVGCLGVPHLLDHLVKHYPLPAFAIIGEPTMMQVVTAHKGVLSFETTVHGHEAHSSQPLLGVNAVHVACELVHGLKQLASELEASGRRDGRFNPSHTTVHVGTIQGGTARNIIPKTCVFQWEIRPLPGENTQLLLDHFHKHCQTLEHTMQQTHADAHIATRPISRMTGVTLPSQAHDARQTIMRCAHTNHEHAVAFGTEAGVFNERGIPAIVCGPGSIEQAHKPDEFIAQSQIEACIDFMTRLMKEPVLLT